MELDNQEMKVVDMALQVFLSNLQYDGEEEYDNITEEQVRDLQVRIFRAMKEKTNA